MCVGWPDNRLPLGQLERKRERVGGEGAIECCVGATYPLCDDSLRLTLGDTEICREIGKF